MNHDQRERGAAATDLFDYRTSVRVDFFKPSGKWYATEAVDVGEGHWDDPDMWGVLKRALRRREDGTLAYSGMTAVCLEPYSKYSHPISFVVPEWP